MGFYEQISMYYDYIFPAGEQQVNFVKIAAGAAPKRVMDVACGSGGYSVALSTSGYSVTAIDLDDKMVEMARKKSLEKNLNMEVLKCDMKDIARLFKPQFDCIFCIGNSIVHLGSMADIQDVLVQMRSKLVDGGVLILQTINYDRIIKYNISRLPAIRNEEIGLEFTRDYSYEKTRNLIHFNTVLTVDHIDGRETFENSIELLPVMYGDLIKMLEDAGFKNIETYGDFNYSVFDDNSYMLVVKGTG